MDRLGEERDQRRVLSHLHETAGESQLEDALAQIALDARGDGERAHVASPRQHRARGDDRQPDEHPFPHAFECGIVQERARQNRAQHARLRDDQETNPRAARNRQCEQRARGAQLREQTFIEFHHQTADDRPPTIS